MGAAYGVLFCDLDGFRPINDRFGHRAGDRLLVELARRLEDGWRTWFGPTTRSLGGISIGIAVAVAGAPESTDEMLARQTRPCAARRSAAAGVQRSPARRSASDRASNGVTGSCRGSPGHGALTRPRRGAALHHGALPVSVPPRCRP